MSKVRHIGIMSNVSFGLRDCGRPVLSFAVNMLDGIGCLQVLSMEEAAAFIIRESVIAIKDLEGHACILETEAIPWGAPCVFIGLFPAPGKAAEHE